MDMTITKILITCLVCELTGLATSAPLSEANRNYTRSKRSPANNFSFFGIRPVSFIPNPVMTAQQTYNVFGNFLSPASHNRNNVNTIDGQSPVYGKRPVKEPPFNSSPERNNNFYNQNTATIPPDMIPPTRTSTQNIKEHKSYEHEKENAAVPSINKNEDLTSNKDNDVNKQVVNREELDQTVIDAIFRIKESTTTENDSTTTVDYTTETGDYESTTSLDEFLRIPAPVVASLLG